MTTLDTIRGHLKDAMRAKDELRLNVVRAMITACTNELVSKGKKPTDPLDEKDVIAVLKRLVKQRKDAAEQFTNGGRPELAEKEMSECALIEAYLPQMASRAEIQAAAEAVLAEVGKDPSKIGIVTGQVMKKLAGNADGNEVKAVLAELLK
jgi:uncharacterized protein YqeY